MSGKVLGGWGVKWLRMWTREWVDRDTGLRSPAVRIYRQWYYGRWPSQYSVGRGGGRREQFYYYMVWNQVGEIVEQGCIHGSDGLGLAKQRCEVFLSRELLANGPGFVRDR
jgi:hypothetical protein